MLEEFYLALWMKFDKSQGEELINFKNFLKNFMGEDNHILPMKESMIQENPYIINGSSVAQGFNKALLKMQLDYKTTKPLTLEEKGVFGWYGTRYKKKYRTHRQR